jgi:hypothetical protein
MTRNKRSIVAPHPAVAHVALLKVREFSRPVEGALECRCKRRCSAARMVRSADMSDRRMRLAYCRGGIGVRDDGGAGVGLRAGETDGCAGGSGVLAISSATAASNRAI